MKAGKQIFEFWHRIRPWTRAPGHAVRILKFLWFNGTWNRLDGPESAISFGIGKWLFFEPADRNGSASHVGKGGFHPRVAAESLVQALAEAAQTKRVPEDQYGKGARQICGLNNSRGVGACGQGFRFSLRQIMSGNSGCRFRMQARYQVLQAKRKCEPDEQTRKPLTKHSVHISASSHK